MTYYIIVYRVTARKVAGKCWQEEMMGYTVFSRFYDAAMRSYSWCSRFLPGILNPSGVPSGGGTLLELGCGTGRVLELLSNDFSSLHGIDISPEMLEIAGKRLPEAELHLLDMRSFTLGQQFSAVICVFDTINHLTSFEEWKKTFRTARAHLIPGGIFLLDINTPRRLQRLSLLPPFLTEMEGGGLVLMDIQEVSSNDFHFDVQIFESLGEELFRRHREVIHEHTVDPERVFAELKNLFTSATVYDEDFNLAEGARQFAESSNGRMFFVCCN